MKTYIAKQSDVNKRWYLIDADGEVLGRLASAVASILRGKNKPFFSPNMDCGDNVIIINAEKIKVTGRKKEDKLYRKHTGYIGSLKETNMKEMLEKKPRFVLEHAIKGMLPKNRLGRTMLANVKIYRGSEHPHKAQKPEILQVGNAS